MAAALARKRPSPLERGRKDVWAAAIVYCLGTVNFLFDKSQAPYMRADELADLFGVSQKTAANKARQTQIGGGLPGWSIIPSPGGSW